GQTPRLSLPCPRPGSRSFPCGPWPRTSRPFAPIPCPPLRGPGTPFPDDLTIRQDRVKLDHVSQDRRLLLFKTQVVSERVHRGREEANSVLISHRRGIVHPSDPNARLNYRLIACLGAGCGSRELL